MARHDEQIGHKLGPRLAAIVAQTVIAARQGLAPHEARVHAAATQQVVDRMGLEVADLMRPLFDEARKLGNHHELAEQLVATGTSGRHQWQAVAFTALGMSGAPSALSSIMSNYLAPVTRQIVAADPQLAPDVGSIIAMGQRGLISWADVEAWLARAGLNSSWAARLRDVTWNYGDPTTAMDLANRGLIGRGEFDTLIRRQGVEPGLSGHLWALREQLLAPADAALAVLRGNMTRAAGEAAAARAGVPAVDFAILLDNTGEPLALESLLEAQRRGFIDQARLDRGIRQSRVRNEWIDVANKLAFTPMSTADAIEAVVQGHMGEAEARAKAHQNGLEPADFAPLLATAGEPLSRTEMEQLFNRGLVTKAEVEQALRESRLKPKYTALAFDLHTRLPEGRQVVSALTHGAISKAEAARLLAQLGYDKTSADMLLAEGTHARLAAHHALTVAEIRQLHMEGVFTEAHTAQLLHGLGYDDADSAALIKSWDLMAAAAITRQAVGVVRSHYVARRLDAQAASNDLDSLGIPATARDRYLHIWDIERAASVAVLTEAQVVQAHKRGLISGPDALARLAAKGYTDDDAHLLLGVAPGQAVP